MPGPPKTPSHLVLVKGNPSKRPINQNEPKPEKGIPNTPKHLDKMGKYWFQQIAQELDNIGVLTQLDAKALELLIEAYTEYRRHCEALDTEGYTYRVETQTGDVMIKAHPAAAMKADAWKRIRAMLAEFGMTPASRSKVNAGGPDKADPLEEFLKARD